MQWILILVKRGNYAHLSDGVHGGSCTILMRFLRIFRCFRSSQHIAESFDLAKMSNYIKVS